MKAGLDPERLRNYIMAGVITLGEMLALSEAVEVTSSTFIIKVDALRDERESLKSE